MDSARRVVRSAGPGLRPARLISQVPPQPTPAERILQVVVPVIARVLRNNVGTTRRSQDHGYHSLRLGTVKYVLKIVLKQTILRPGPMVGLTVALLIGAGRTGADIAVGASFSPWKGHEAHIARTNFAV